MAFAVISMMSLTGCYSRVEAGNVGVKINLLGSDKGVESEVLKPGRYWIGMNEELYIFPTSQQNYTWTASKEEGKAVDESFTFQTADGMTIGTDVGVSYQVNPDKVPALFQKYRKGLDDVTNIHLRNAVRDELNRQGALDSISTLIGAGKGRLFKAVQDTVSRRFDSIGIVGLKLYIIGNFRLPAAIEASINSKIAATQKAQQAENELATAEAEGKKTVALAEAEARANTVRQQSITPQLLQLEAIKKWNGVLPQVAGGATPFINLK